MDLSAQNPATWPDGTPRSQNNAFTTSYGVPLGESLERHAQVRKTSTASRERRQAAGTDNSSIHGMSRRADAAIQRQRHGGVFMKAKGRTDHG